MDDDDFSDIESDDLLHQLRSLAGAIAREGGFGPHVGELAKGFVELDKRLREGTVLPRAWQRSAVITLSQ